MYKAYKYELNLTAAQSEFMNKSFGCARFVYNYCLDRRIVAYKDNQQNISWVDLDKNVSVIKRTENYGWLTEVATQMLSQSIRSLDRSYKNFFDKKSGFPRFKSKHGKQSCQFPQGVKIDFESEKIRFPKIGWCRAYISCEFSGRIKTTTVSRNAVGKYFVSILVDNSEPLPVKLPINEATAVGVDVGIKHFAVLSTGEKIENPKYYEALQKRLVALQRRLSRRKKGSNRYKRQKLAVAKVHYKIVNQRKDFLHKLSSKIISENQTVIIEDLNVGGMLKNHCLAKSISSVSWSEFFRQLEYKTSWYGKNLIRIGRFEPSSKMCTCGSINQNLKLSDREWTCESCGVAHDRDLLAANNIKRFGLRNSPAGSGVEDVEPLAIAGAEKRQVNNHMPKHNKQKIRNDKKP